jgi:A/G-specific adenine glycosylase
LPARERASSPREERFAELCDRLARWFERERRDLPWRKTRDPYAIWLSEVMLQQTRVKTVEDYFPRFLRAYPTVAKLARADLSAVLGAWSGLGYYRRARALHQGAREVVEKYGGELPRDAAALRSIAGIGPYTAGAIASIAFDAREALVDGNVARVLSRIFALTCDVKTPAGSREVWSLARALVPEQNPGRHNESLMELGAMVCLPGQPRCDSCPVRDLCEGHARGIASDLPVASKKKAPREVELWALVSRRGKEVLLGRRREGGLFAGLWEPPMVEPFPGKSAGALFGALLGIGDIAVEAIGEQTHVLTHRKLHVRITTGAVAAVDIGAAGEYDRFEWQKTSDLKRLGMSSLAKKVLLACPG